MKFEGYMTGYGGETQFFSENDKQKESFVNNFDLITKSLVPRPTTFICKISDNFSGIFFDGADLYKNCYNHPVSGVFGEKYKLNICGYIDWPYCEEKCYNFKLG